jgi:hypothetical protein
MSETIHIAGVVRQLEERSQESWKSGLGTTRDKDSGNLKLKTRVSWRRGLSKPKGKDPGLSWSRGLRTAGRQDSGQLEERT